MPNNIFVTYTPQTTGKHRICYRLLSGPGPIGPDPTFCCIEDIDITAALVNVVRNAPAIDAGVTACDSGGPVTPVGIVPGDYIYEGYVQPVCDPGEIYKVAWPVNVTFTVLAP